MLLKVDLQSLVNIEKRDRIYYYDDENVAGINIKNEDVLKSLKVLSEYGQTINS